MKALGSFYNKYMPYILIVFMRIGLAGKPIFVKLALNNGMNQHVFVVYRFAVATLVLAPFAIAFDRPMIDQNLYYTGMKYTTATVATALSNVVPAFVFLLAWICRFEKVNTRKLNSQAKIFGTIGSVGGAIIMTVVNGPMLPLPWTKINDHNNQPQSEVSATKEDPLKGAIMILFCCVCLACFIILQSITLKSYPAELSLTTLICLIGTIGAAIFAVIMEGNNPAAWAIHWDSKLLASVYSGVVCSGIAYYIGAIVIKAKGPVFFAAFGPLTVVIVAIISTFIFSEIMYLGRVIGATVIIFGIYLVLWGKSKDQHSSDSDSTDNMTTDVPSIEQTPITSNQEFVVLDVNKDESIKRNPQNRVESGK